jgi:hypothetical protein
MHSFSKNHLKDKRNLSAFNRVVLGNEFIAKVQSAAGLKPT